MGKMMGFTVPDPKGNWGKQAKGFVTGETPLSDLEGVSAPIKIDYEQTELDAEKIGTIGDQYTTDFDAAGADQQNREAAQATAAQVGSGAQIDAAGQAQTGNQAAIIGALQNRAAGNAPSAAEMQMGRSRDQAIAAAQAQAAGQVGLSAGQAARMASQQSGAAIQDIAGQSAILRAQEQAGAEQALVGAIQGARGQDLQGASLIQDRLLTQAGMDQATVMANLQSEQGQRALNDQMTSMYIEQGFSRDQAQQQAATDLAALQVQQDQLRLDAAKAQAEADQKTQSGVFGAIGTAFSAFSDKRMKKGIKEAKNEVDDLLGALKSYSFKYKDDSLNSSDEPQIGIMAQDAEKSSLGQSFVEETEEGKKYLSGDKALGAILASLGRLAERMDNLTKKKGDK